MGKAKVAGAGSSKIINSIVEQYMSYSEDIKVNTFVEFVSDIESSVLGNDCGEIYGLTSIDAVQINNNSVFIVYVVSRSSYPVYAIIVTLDGTTVSYGARVTISSGGSSGWGPCYVSLLSENKVILSYYNNEYLSNYRVARICAIEGSVVSVGATTQNYPEGPIAVLDASTVCFLENKDVHLAKINGFEIVKKSKVQIGYSSFNMRVDAIDSASLIETVGMPYELRVVPIVRNADDSLTKGTEAVFTTGYSFWHTIVVKDKVVTAAYSIYQSVVSPVRSGVSILQFTVNELDISLLIRGDLSPTYYHILSTDHSIVQLEDSGVFAVETTYYIVFFITKPSVQVLGSIYKNFDGITGCVCGFNNKFLVFGQKKGNSRMLSVYDYITDLKLKSSIGYINGVTRSKVTAESFGTVQLLNTGKGN